MGKCGRCWGHGEIRVPARGSTQAKPLFTMVECGVCMGFGWAKRKRVRTPRPDGLFAVHSTDAQHMSVDGILKRMGL